MLNRGLLIAVVVCASGVADAQPQTNLTTPTAWVTVSNVTEAGVSTWTNQGYRIVDIEVESVDPIRFSATMVHNSGDYGKGWWWYYAQTETQVNALLAANNARLIDAEPYETASGLRFAVVMIHNSGNDFAPSHGLRTGFTGADIDAWVGANPTQRIIDIQPYFIGGNLRYAFVYLSNTGQNASGWWYYYNVSPAFISTQLGNNNARLIDLEETFPDSNTWSCIMVPNDGKAWWWYTGVASLGDVGAIADQLGARVIDFQRYTVGANVRYAMILRRNTNDLTQNINTLMRQTSNGSSGFLLRRLGGAEVAAINRNFVFEPASLMKTVHLVHAMRQVALGNAFLDDSILLSTQTTPNNSCPAPLNPPVFIPLSEALSEMMEVSSNEHTEAVRSYFGTAAILNTANNLLGMTNTQLNHTLGCLCGNPNNSITLHELYLLHTAVGNGFVNPFRSVMLGFMRNGLNNNPTNGAVRYLTVLNAELAASSLKLAERDAFRFGVQLATKPGGYTCISSVTSEHRSEGGYLRIPFRSGCNIVDTDYFFGAFVNDGTNGTNATNAVGAAMIEMFRDRVRAAIATWEAVFCPTCRHADINNDNVVDFDDFSTVLAQYGQTGSALSGDVNGDGVVDFADFSVVLQYYGQNCGF